MSPERTESSLVKANESAAITLTPETVLAYVNSKATKQEVALFLNQCAMFGLNPFKREIYLIKYKEGEPATFVVGYESYLKRAERTQKWAGLESGTEDDKNGQPIKAWAKVYRKDWTAPLYHEVYLSEYVQTKKDYQTGKVEPTRFWATKPRTMLKKVAIAQAVRMAFPDEFGGMPYTAEEMPIDHSTLPTMEIKIDTATPKVAPAVVHKPKNVEDEFTAGKPLPADTEPEAAEPDPFDEAHHDTPEKVAAKTAEIVVGPTLAQLEKFGKSKADLISMDVSETVMWDGIQRFAMKNINHGVVELSELTPAEVDSVLGYLDRWRKARHTEIEGAKGKKS